MGKGNFEKHWKNRSSRKEGRTDKEMALYYYRLGLIYKTYPVAESPTAMAGCVPDLRQCAVTDMNENHCQDEPEHFVKLKSGKVVELCGNCYIAWTHKCFEK